MDGGATYSPNAKISNKPSDDSANSQMRVFNNYGEYDGLGVYKGIAYYAWSDNSADPNGNKAIFFASMATGCTPIGGGGGGGGGQLPNDRFELNDTSNTATQFGVLAGSQAFANLTINHHPGTGLPDFDWYQWTAGKSGTFTAHIDYQSTHGGDLHMRIYTLVNGMLEQLGSSRNIGVTSQQVSVKVGAGEPLLAWIYGFNHEDGTYTLTDSLA